MRKLLLVATIIVAMFSFDGCTQIANDTSRATKNIKIGVCISSFNDKYRSYLLNEMKNYSKSLKDVEVTYVDSKNDSTTQLSQVEDFISQGVDAIVVNIVYTDSSKAMTDKAKAAGIPIISVMTPFENQDDAASYITSDSKQAGTLEMEYLAKKMNYKGNVAIMMGQMGDKSQKVRTEACRDVIAKYPDMKVVVEQSANWDRARGMALMESWLQSGKEIDAVASNNDEMAIGALKAIEASGKLGKIIVGGIDATPDSLDYLKKGELAVTVFQDATKIGKSSIDTAIKTAKGESVQKTINLENELVTPENVDQYIAKWKK